MEMAALSQEVLLHVLSFLPARDLLRCRATCRRWRDLALLPALWRHKKLEANSRSDCQLVAAALRLAPCLFKLTIANSYGEWDSLAVVLCATSCPIRELDLSISVANVVLVTAVLARQAALGELKSISLTSWHDVLKSKLSEVRQLLEFLLHTEGLESINIHMVADPAADFLRQSRPLLLNAAKGAARVASSLRRLAYTSTLRDPCLRRHLEWHAATLEVVELRVHHAGVAPLLGALPRLRELKCPLLDRMPALLQCPSLKKVHLVVNLDASTAAFMSGAAVFVRGAASRLEQLVLEYPDGEDRVAATGLVASLAGCDTAAPTLRSLSIETEDGVYGDQSLRPMLPPLAATLHRLGALVTLAVPTVSYDLLEALDGDALPNLEQLSFAFLTHCPHQWAHSQPVAAALQRCPRLHLSMLTYHRYQRSQCAFCQEHSCHDFSNDGRWTLFSHPKQALCGVKHSHEEMYFPSTTTVWLSSPEC